MATASNKIDRLIESLEGLTNLSAEEYNELQSSGYVAHELVADAAEFLDQQKRKAAFRNRLKQLDAPAKEAWKQIGYALRLDSGPTYKTACQSAFMHLAGLDSFDYQDPDLLKKITDSS